MSRTPLWTRKVSWDDLVAFQLEELDEFRLRELLVPGRVIRTLEYWFQMNSGDGYFCP